MRQTDYTKAIADAFIQSLKTGTLPWKQNWERWCMPSYNAVTGKPYQGLNQFFLFLIRQGRELKDPRFITRKQAMKLGGYVKKDAVGLRLMFWKEVSPSKNSENVFETETTEEEKRPKAIPICFVVYSVEDCAGLNLEPVKGKIVHTWDSLAVAEDIIAKSGAQYFHEGDHAFYMPDIDLIQLPCREQFLSADDFYSVALHELAHWTGHSSRLNRSLKNSFGSENYAKEELRAEIASFMICSSIGIKNTFDQSAAYVNSWIKILENNPKEIMAACRDAKKIRDFLLKPVLPKIKTTDSEKKLATRAVERESSSEPIWISRTNRQIQHGIILQ